MDNLKFGIQCMNEAQTGKILYHDGRIYIDFAHNNYFPAGGTHTGDTLISVNDNGEDEQLHHPWFVSHNCAIRLSSDGTHLLQGAMGEFAFSFAAWRYDDMTKKTWKKSHIIDGHGGTGGGHSMGRIGDIIWLGDKFAVGFIRRKVKDITLPDPDSEFGILFFDS